MSQSTLVLRVPPKDQSALRARLEALDLEWRTVPHARFSAKGQGAVVTLYNSGKLVIQSADPAAFVLQHTGLDLPEGAGSSPSPGPSPRASDQGPDPLLAITGPVVGSDEAGKGDYFGPLTVAAVRLEPEQAAKLVDWGVTDSKRLTDPRALKLAALLRGEVEHAVERLDPPAYNAAHSRRPNVNLILADLHGTVIRAVAQSGDAVVVDQFAGEQLMRGVLKGLDVDLHQAPRAERHVAVAAASILARAEFLLGLADLETACGVGLHKGAGAPTDQAGVAYARALGMDALGEVAKLHFKNTGKIARRVS